MDLMRTRESEVRGERVAYVGYGSEGSSHALELVELIDPQINLSTGIPMAM